MYWTHAEAYKLAQRGDNDRPIFIPNPRKVVDTTAYYLLKGLEIKGEKDDPESPFGQFLKAFLKREKFYSRFDVAKHSGVTKGDYVFHITADPTQPEGSRISLTSVDPGSYFPIMDEDDLDKRSGVRLVEQWDDETDFSVTKVKILDYRVLIIAGKRRIAREESIWKMEGWDHPEKAVLLKTLIPYSLLPENITQIPVYAFKNQDWQGQPFGSSELRGFERLFQGVNQAISDTELALELEGLGVYATDGGRPTNAAGEDEDWVIAPGVVLEVPGATMFKRVEGIKSIQPNIDFIEFLQDSLYEASGTSQVAMGKVDVNVAESGIALAIQFIPTLAKVEQRDRTALDILSNLWFDLMFWVKEFEQQDFTTQVIVPTLGDKLPLNRPKKMEELNNMLDRAVISKTYYRQEMEKLGYSFPKDIETQILEEQKKATEAKTPPQLLGANGAPLGVPGPGGRLQGKGDTLPPPPSTSNNKAKVNESKGTEIVSGKK